MSDNDIVTLIETGSENYQHRHFDTWKLDNTYKVINKQEY